LKILIVSRVPSRSGARPTQTKKIVTADWIRVGRNASCELHLPDPRIALEQGMIVDRDGLVYLEGEGGSHNITRKSVRAVRLKPGEPIDVGPYRIEALPKPEGYDGAISVEMMRPAELTADLESRTSRTTLAAVGASKRRTAWTLALILLAMCFLIPASRVLDLPWKDATRKAGLGDRMWNPGPVLLAHQPIEQNCAACHEVAFQHVKDRACLQCHGTIGHHVGPQLQPAALFQGARCTSCHKDHKGAKTTHRDDDRFCVDCHKDIAARSGGATALNVADFASAHPPFRLSLPDGNQVKRVRQGTTPMTEKSNLAFPHAPHLDPKGVRSPEKGRVKLDCGSCHQPDASKRTFEPISMGKHCQECHRLEFEPAVTHREVPHGKPSEAVTVIEEFYANLALKGVRDSFQKAFGVPGEGLLRRAGEPSASERQDALRIASRKAKQVTKELFEVRVCVTCHEVSREWNIAPVRAANQWMPHARFDHKAHASSKCAVCHDVARSKSADDIAMPTIENCRECHGGSRPMEKKVTSNCLLCHGFHDAKHLWNPGAEKRATHDR
jgi:predicted CXXCH cytochrome family protein